MKLITYNVNGIRAAIRKGFIEWLIEEDPDVICLQEVKAEQIQVPLEQIEALGYHIHWFSAEKKGYSGVAIFSKKTALSEKKGIEIEKYDQEGRVIQLAFDDYILINTYFPSGTRGETRQLFKYEWLDDFFNYINHLKETNPNIIICGDLNICHTRIDIHNPDKNKNTSGFLPEEREWMTKFLGNGFIDTFRYLNKDTQSYTWWSYRAKSREKNLGWRLDYFIMSATLTNKLKNCTILNTVNHSDHCPVSIELFD